MPTLAMEVARALRERLIGGAYPGGARLNELDLAREFGMSRTPIRAALHTLSSEGFLDYRANAGFVARKFTARFVGGVYDVRASLEGLAAQLAAERGIDDAMRGRMHRIIEETDALIASDRRDAAADAKLAELNDAFHMAFIEAADNQHLMDTLRRTRALPLVNRAQAETFDFAFSARAHEDHRVIFEAILGGQGARAEAVAREHVRRGAARMTEYARALEAAERAPAD